MSQADQATAERAGTPHPAAESRERVRPPQPPADEDREPREGTELLEAAARVAKGRGGEQLTEEEQADALEWFLSDEPDEVVHSFELNVGSPTRKKWVTWTIKPVDSDKLRRIRRSSRETNRRARITGQQQLDPDRANIEIVVEGTVSPDLRAAAQQIGLVDPADAVRRKFRKKPGLVDQIAGEIMSLSGYDDDDVREVNAARG